jgi:hypothetical protein
LSLCFFVVLVVEMAKTFPCATNLYNELAIDQATIKMHKEKDFSFFNKVFKVNFIMSFYGSFRFLRYVFTYEKSAKMAFF